MTGRVTINRTAEIMLTMFGVWPGMSCVAFSRVFWIIALILSELFHYQYFVTHLNLDDLFGLMDCLSTFLAHIKMTVKIVIMSLKQQKFIEILTMIADDWRDCSNGDDASCEVARKTKLSNRICNGLIILHTIGALTNIVVILLTDVDIDDQTIEPPLMMKMAYPFIIDTQRKYRLVLTTQFVLIMVCSWGAGLFNALLLTLTLHAGSQVNILLRWLTRTVPAGEDDTRRVLMVTMTKIIRKHQRVISFSENIESLYSYITLLHFALNTVMICSLGFIIVTAIGNPDAAEQLTRYLLFYAMTNAEAFIFCFAGEYLKNKSSAIGNAMYNTMWYDMSAKDRRILLFVILRSQKHLTLTAGGMIELSLESFTSIYHIFPPYSYTFSYYKMLL